MESPIEQLALGAIALRLLGVLLLVLANAFFVATEFALVSSRRSRVDALAARGDRSARAVQQTLDRITRYLSATQLGITLTSLGLGYIGENTMGAVFEALFRWAGFAVPSAVAHTVAASIAAFLVITYLQIVLGELAPRTIALTNPEGISRILVRPLRWFAAATAPFTWLLNASAQALVRLVGLQTVSETARVHSPEELRLLVMQTTAHGLLDETDSAMLAGVFDFHNKKVRDVMRPRTEIAALPLDATEDDVRTTLQRERYSRYPVYRESLDDVVGIFVAKDLWIAPDETPFSLQHFVREALYVPDTRGAERVLDDLRRTRAHMAVVLDEYGGTAGIITLEDLVEEVIGDIADEYDVAAREAVEMNGVLELAGSLSLIDVRSDHHIAIPGGSWSTLGGFVFSRLGRLPKVGDRVPFPGGELEVVAMDGRRVAAVRVHRAGTEGKVTA
ncbi:MAG TPA: hemolysin family protein [Gemmatimonadaceae bacterium]|nr:hemolysin family protein [Gemmatimonadaceae bacterium]